MAIKRGRKSSASMEISAPAKIETIARLLPPHHLTDEEVEVWHAAVNAESADWFTPSNGPMLAQYCRHVVHSHRIASLIERAVGNKNLKITAYDRLLKMQERESRCIASLATKMRVSQQATTNHRGNKKASISRPWED